MPAGRRRARPTMAMGSESESESESAGEGDGSCGREEEPRRGARESSRKRARRLGEG